MRDPLAGFSNMPEGFPVMSCFFDRRMSAGFLMYLLLCLQGFFTVPLHWQIKNVGKGRQSQAKGLAAPLCPVWQAPSQRITSRGKLQNPAIIFLAPGLLGDIFSARP